MSSFRALPLLVIWFWSSDSFKNKLSHYVSEYTCLYAFQVPFPPKCNECLTWLLYLALVRKEPQTLVPEALACVCFMYDAFDQALEFISQLMSALFAFSFFYGWHTPFQVPKEGKGDDSSLALVHRLINFLPFTQLIIIITNYAAENKLECSTSWRHSEHVHG